MLDPGRAELAFALIDEYQGQGIGTALISTIARGAGSPGTDRRGVTRKCRDAGRIQEERFAPDNRQERGVVHVTLRL